MQLIEVTWYDTDIAVIALHGEHDAGSAHRLARTLRSSTDAGDRVIVDLTQAEFIDSAVIHALLDGERLARERHSSLTLQVGATALVRKVLEITGIPSRLACASSREEAIRAARGRHAAGGGRAGGARPVAAVR